ncbi:1,2-phenylacetyl-CoA epoxidase subunit PaaC [Terricaulis silvestris]|uniref:1,2-phenylacetyl-CoA monooxygenase, subunit C n=1 Tax=Terricaulis silvestris TaxID=2686094 RepID=A0A6I6MGP3_9CAUL|nr:1,2-phenylacetyl-CoA epoxidase subunit PaaC [Terricaulis silvestris]QGZ93840.1 1,2-phenylacetyl-CoA monooxygenase, subunit C [Terricaulis silvestris]
MSPLATYALRLGDDSLILGQRLGEWCGHAPALEVDLSLANVALDQVGQATHFLGLAGALEGEGRDGDALAFRRDVMDFTNCLLVEQPNGDFAQTIARLFLFSHYQELLFMALMASKDAQLSAIAAKAVKETAYHVTLASDWVVRLGDGTEESRARMIAGLDWMWRFADELFAMDDVDATALEAGVGVDKAALRAAWDARIDAVLADATLERPASRRPVLGGRVGRHSEHLGHLLTEMQFLQRAYPGATW